MAKYNPQKVMVIEGACEFCDDKTTWDRLVDEVTALYKKARQQGMMIISSPKKSSMKGKSSRTILRKLRKCRKCGCTDLRACPGGCAWVAEDLCSKCG